MRRIADSLGVPEREIGYAGLKDARAVTTQWLSVPASCEERARSLDLHGITVLAARRHGIPRIYAIGDVLGPSRVMLAHVASREGMVAAENAVGGTARMSYDAVPNVIFTMPEISNVGLTEAQAKEQGLQVRAESVLFRNIAKPHVIGEIGGMAKIVFDGGSERLLGVHLVGPCASDLIAEGALAVKSGRTIQELADTIHGHPTLAEIMSEVSMKALGKPIHG